MVDIEKIDKELYNLFFTSEDENNEEKLELMMQEYWEKIRTNKIIIKEAIKLQKDEKGKYIFKAPTICDFLLAEYMRTPKEVYKEIINKIYKYPDLARYSLNINNEKDTFLLMTLWNDNLDLTKEQKDFAVSEAMNQFGTVKYFNIKESLINKINTSGILKEFKVSDTLFTNNVEHGNLTDDIRYYILRNHNWTFEEKRNLLMEFYMDDELLSNLLIYWNNRVLVNLKIDFNLSFEDCFDIDEDYIMELYKDYPEDGMQIVKDIELCKLINYLIFSPKPYSLEREEFIYS